MRGASPVLWTPISAPGSLARERGPRFDLHHVIVTNDLMIDAAENRAGDAGAFERAADDHVTTTAATDWPDVDRRTDVDVKVENVVERRRRKGEFGHLVIWFLFDLIIDRVKKRSI